MTLFTDELKYEDQTNGTSTSVKAGIVTIADNSNILELKPDGIYQNGEKTL
ncbi:hypothetical protein [Oceanobacillus saliphilus]|uniref:hypothetical protein n=1 Tax=Oceanobacillus saliphilus TaxID=2925834 RepID=UPI00201E19FD|nr:hypothetical protein [Oceanobacillus saliphilus]